MRKISIVFILIAFANLHLFAQDLRKKAEESPLDCAYYLMAKDESLAFYEFENLASAFFSLGRFDDTLRAINLADDNHSNIYLLSNFSIKFIKIKNKTQANEFLDNAIEVLRKSDDENDWDYDYNDFALRQLTLGFAAADRFGEVFEILSHQTDNDSKTNLLLELAESLSRTGQKQKSAQLVNEIFKINQAFEDSDKLIRIAEIYSNIGQNDKTFETLEKLQEKIAAENIEKDRYIKFLQIVKIYIQIGQVEKAVSLWNQHHKPDDYSDMYSLMSALINKGYIEQAKPYLLVIESDEKSLRYFQDDLVKIYLELGDLEAASRIAESSDSDNYSQQASLMLIADKFIAAGQNEKAFEILNSAYQKARQTEEEHLPQHSIGASSLTRKIIYLRNIRNRYFSLKEYEKGLKITRAFKSNDSLVKKFQADSLVQFVKYQTKTLSRKKAYEILDHAQSIFDEDEERELNEIRLKAAEVLALMGNKSKALKTLTKTLEAVDYDETDFLISAGRVFEQNNLKADANMRRVLRQLIEDAE